MNTSCRFPNLKNPIKTKSMKTIIKSMSLTVALVATCPGALISGISVESGTTNPFNTEPMGPLKAINGEGLPDSQPALAGAHGTSFDQQWWTFGGTTNNLADVTINLNGVYALDTIQIWNYNEAGVISRGIQNAQIFVSPDGNVANLVKLTTNGTGSFDNGTGDFLLPQAPGNPSYEGFTLDLAGITDPALLGTVQLVQIRAINGYSTNNDDGTGLAEIQFGGSPIPEPSSLVLTAFAGLGLLRRRR